MLVALVGGLLAGCGASQETPKPSRVFIIQASEMSPFIEDSAPLAVQVIDAGGLVESVRAATKDDAGVLPDWPIGVPIQAATLPGTDRSILIEWIGSACDRAATVTLSPSADQIVVAPSRTKSCDAVPSYRGVVVTFLGAVHEIQFELELLATQPIGL